MSYPRSFLFVSVLLFQLVATSSYSMSCIATFTRTDKTPFNINAPVVSEFSILLMDYSGKDSNHFRDFLRHYLNLEKGAQQHGKDPSRIITPMEAYEMAETFESSINSYTASRTSLIYNFLYTFGFRGKEYQAKVLDYLLSEAQAERVEANGSQAIYRLFLKLEPGAIQPQLFDTLSRSIEANSTTHNFDQQALSNIIEAYRRHGANISQSFLAFLEKS